MGTRYGEIIMNGIIGHTECEHLDYNGRCNFCNPFTNERKYKRCAGRECFNFKQKG